MAMTVFDVDMTRTQRLFEALKISISDWSPVLYRIRKSYLRQIDEQLKLAGTGATGGYARGVFWEPFEEQYARKDGTVVPAHGGVAKVRGKGNVKGRRTQSGRRINAGSRLWSGVGAKALVRILAKTSTSITLTLADDYDAYQHRSRQYLFSNQEDQARSARIASRWVDEQIARAQRS